MPIEGSSSCNFWVDLQVTTSAPAGASYRLWPSYPTLPGNVSSDTAGYTLATEFQLSEASSLDNIWFYSASGAGALAHPVRDLGRRFSKRGLGHEQHLARLVRSSRVSGWVSCSYSGVTLPAGDYKVAVFYGGGSQWYQPTTGYWSGGGPGASGITTGPLTAPGAVRRLKSGPGNVQQGLLGLSADLRLRRQWRELLDRCRGHALPT